MMALSTPSPREITAPTNAPETSASRTDKAKRESALLVRG